jgi:nucleotide-binding universal stress UspA family protein
MQKVVIAFDGSNFSEGAFRFARQMNKMQPIILTGVFLPQTEYANLWSYATAVTPVFVPLVEGDESDLIQQNIALFQQRCVAENIEFRVHKEFWDFALPELRKESRYTDLLIVGSETFYSNLSNSEVNLYLQDVLHDAECPVVIVPEQFNFPVSNILAYDGTASSVFAIKQFTYLFPDFCSNPTTLTHTTREESKSLPQQPMIQELVAAHFKDVTTLHLELDLKKYFGAWMSEQKGSILVCGSFGRSGLSRMVKSSFVADVIADHKVPVFIAHKS